MQKVQAVDVLKAGVGFIPEYDKPSGRQSMSKACKIFNIMTELNLTDEHCWLLMGILNQVRSQDGDFVRGYYENEAVYAALRAECASVERNSKKDIG